LFSLSWGLIGAGDIVRKRVGEALREGRGCELVAVSRARTELLESFARKVGARRWHADWRDLIADDEVDAVYVATPVHLHAEQTVAAAEAGKHVLCEKPMVMTAAECDRMIAACRAHGVRLGIAYYRRFYPAVEAPRRPASPADHSRREEPRKHERLVKYRLAFPRLFPPQCGGRRVQLCLCVSVATSRRCALVGLQPTGRRGAGARSPQVPPPGDPWSRLPR
jgi:Oxidoreductase family, NAD-binding Rossmann fold